MQTKLLTLKPQTFKCFHLDILTQEDKLIFWVKQHPYIANLVSYQQLSFILTLVTIQYNNKTITLPFWIGITPISEYKKLRAYLSWN